MKKRNSFFFTCLLSLVMPTGSNAQWEHGHGLDSAYVNALSVNGTYLFAGTRDSGIFRSGDSGVSWLRSNAGLTNLNIRAITKRGTNLFAGTYGGGVFRSADNGASWQAMNTGISTLNIQALDGNDSFLFAGTSGGGVCRSSDSGEHWLEVSHGLVHINVFSLGITRMYVFAGTWGSSAFRTADNGMNWYLVTNGLYDPSENIIPYCFAVADTFLFTGTGGGGIFRAKDSARVWYPFNTGLPATAFVTALARIEDTLFAATGTGVFRSIDNGSTANWVPDNSGLTDTAISLAVSGSVIYAGTNGSGVWRRSFSAPVIPSAPVLSLPGNAAPGVAINPTLKWNLSTGASTYTLQVSTAADFATQVINQSGITATSFTASDLLNNTTYYWRVNATNAGGSSAWSAAWSFVTIASSPLTPVLIAPVNAAANLTITPTLSWNTVSGASTYAVQVSTAADFATQVINQSGIIATSYTVGGLLNNTTYYWRVNAANAGGTGAWSDTWSFITIIAIPSIPMAISPDSGAREVTTAPTIIWHSGHNAASYHVQVSTDASFVSVLLDSSDIRDTLMALTHLSNSTTYFWRVSSLNAATQSPWMLGWLFTTLCKKPAPVVTIAYGNDTLKTDSLVCRWTTTYPSVTNYHLQVFSDAALSVLTMSDSTVSDTFFVIRGLHNNQTLWWRVRASNIAGFGPYSDAVRIIVRVPTTTVAPVTLTIALVGSSLNNSTLRYGIPKQCAVSMTVYDILGRSIWNYTSPGQQPGYYTVNIHTSSRSTGQYFLQFIAGDKKRIVPFIKN